MLKFKFNIMESLKNNGYSSYKLRSNKILSESTMQKIRNGTMTLTLTNIDTICKLLNCQPGDIIEYVPDNSSEG